MAQTEDLCSWAKREKLSEEIMKVLQEQSFTCLDDIMNITSAKDIKTFFLDAGYLTSAQCFVLNRAINNISRTQGSTTVKLPPNSPSPPSNSPADEPPQHCHQTAFGGEDRSSGSPAATNSGSIKPQSGAIVNDRDDVYRFLLVGKTGSGKSTTGNTILGEELFRSEVGLASVTSECSRKVTCRGGSKFEVMDCPGLCDTGKPHEEICIEITKAVAGMHPGPNTVLYVISLNSRYTAEDFGTYQRLKGLFDERITQHMIVLFTGGDMLERNNKSIEEVLRTSVPEQVRQVLAECNNRHIVFNNFASDKRPQVERFLSMVREMMTNNKGQPYECPKYASIGQSLEEEVARRLKKVEKEELKQMEYVKQLEREAEQAEETLRKTKEQAEKNEQQRKQLIEEKEREQKRLQDELSAQQKANQDRTQEHEKEIQRLQKEREHHERLMREKESEMTEREKQRAEEELKNMRQHEKKMLDRLTQEKEQMARDNQKFHEKIAQLQDTIQKTEEKRRQDLEDVKKAGEEKEKAWQKQVQEQMKAQKERHDREMENVKAWAVSGRGDSFFTHLGKAVTVVATTALGGFLGGPEGAIQGLYLGASLIKE